MKLTILAITTIVCLVFSSCQDKPKTDSETATNKKEQTNTSQQTKTATESDLIIGSWVEPNPINDKEVQGINLKKDGTAESINMATLVYKKWWMESGKLILVSESIGNETSSIDTTKFEILKKTDKELELKSENYNVKYKRQ